MIADLFQVPKTTAWKIGERFERSENALPLSKSDAKPSPPPNSLLLPEEERRMMAWIGDRQRQGNCPSPRDFSSILHQARTDQERFFSRDWWRGLGRQHQEELAAD
jgi:hypothetical protein